MKPSVPLFVVVTHVSTAAITGAPHGAATSPDAAPITNAPDGRERSPDAPPTTNAPDPRPAVPARDARSSNVCGIGTGKTSNIISAASTSMFAMTKYSHGFVLTVPNNVPVIP